MPKPPLPAERSVSFGFENIVTDNPRWEHFGNHLDRSNANAVAISVGRTDWTAFPWDAHPGSVSSGVSRTGRDYVAEAIEALQPRLGGERRLTLTIDALAPALIQELPGLAGINPKGKRAGSFLGVDALSTGPAGDRVVELTADICARYGPDRVSITELMFDDYTFGDEDLISYREHTGNADWPRTPNGAIDTANPSLGKWRSEALADLLSRARSAAAAHGAELDMDVRAPWSDPNGDRALSGHDYDVLLTEADRIVVWNYFAINGSTPEYGAKITKSLKQRFPGRFVMSTGLWAEDGTVTPAQLESSIASVARAKADAVSVTPVSMMSQAHWDALARLWAA